MSFAFFISESYLKSNTPIGDNVDAKELQPFIKTAQDTYIHEALGTCLYNRLTDSKLASPSNTTPNEQILIVMLKPCLAFYSAYDALPFIWSKIRNVGIQKQKGNDNSETASISEMNYLQKQLKNKADFYLKRVQDYLCCNSSLYPEYRCSCSTCAGLSPNSNVGPSCALAFDKNSNEDEGYKKYYRKWLL